MTRWSHRVPERPSLFDVVIDGNSTRHLVKETAE